MQLKIESDGILLVPDVPFEREALEKMFSGENIVCFFKYHPGYDNRLLGLKLIVDKREGYNGK